MLAELECPRDPIVPKFHPVITGNFRLHQNVHIRVQGISDLNGSTVPVAALCVICGRITETKRQVVGAIHLECVIPTGHHIGVNERIRRQRINHARFFERGRITCQEGPLVGGGSDPLVREQLQQYGSGPAPIWYDGTWKSLPKGSATRRSRLENKGE